MRFVVDAQLPPALARVLSSFGHQAEHVFDIGLDGTEDPVIWDYAIRMGTAIITKDDDFAIRIAMEPSGPSIVWIRIGNTSKQALLSWFKPIIGTIEKALMADEKLN